MAENINGRISFDAVGFRETLAAQAAVTGIEGKTNGLICFQPDRLAFLSRASRTIAHTALAQRVSGGAYDHFGLKGIDTESLGRLVSLIPNLSELRSQRGARIFRGGSKRPFCYFWSRRPINKLQLASIV